MWQCMEMQMSSGDEDADLMTRSRSLPKSLGRILSLREYNSLSPGTSPRTQDIRMVNKTQPSTNNDNLEENIISQGVQVIVKSESCDKEREEQTESVDVSCESHGSLDGVEDDHNAVILDGYNEESSSDNLKPDLLEENVSSSSGLHIEPTVTSKTEGN